MFDPKILANRSIVVTGGGSGLGLAMAKTFAAHGARVMIAGRKRERLDSAAPEIAAALRQRVAAIEGVQEVIDYVVGPVIGAHTGAGTAGAVFVARPV